MVVDLMGVNPASTIRPGIKVQGSSLRRMRLDLSAPDKTRLLLDFRQVKRFMVKTESSPFRIVITTSATDAAMPRGISFGQGLQSSDPLFRFATRSIMIDPGHGGKDPGTVHNGVIEREVTLDIAKRVGSILAGKGIQVHYTRTDNTWVSLSTRSYMANQARADVLLSIHVNASPNENACGLETYFPDTASSSADAGKLAGLENANGGHKGRYGIPCRLVVGSQSGIPPPRRHGPKMYPLRHEGKDLHRPGRRGQVRPLQGLARRKYSGYLG